MSKSQNGQAIGGLFREQLQMCGVKNGEVVVVLSRGEKLSDYAETFAVAATDLGAEAVRLRLGEREVLPLGKDYAGSEAKHLSKKLIDRIDLIKSADMVIDLGVIGFTYEREEIVTAGPRVLVVLEPFEILRRLLPSENLRLRVDAAAKRLARAKTLRFTNSVGTNVMYELGDSKIVAQDGLVVDPGDWDHWPSGFLATCAREGRVNGKVVMNKGDIIFPVKKDEPGQRYPKKRVLEETVEFDIQDGMITEIRGRGDAEWVRQFVEGFSDPRGYAVSHIGWGLNERAEWNVTNVGIGMEERGYYGNVLFSSGPNVEFGGSNDTGCHLDMPMRDCTVLIDGETIMRDGEFVAEDMRATA